MLNVYVIDQTKAGNTGKYYSECRGFYGEHGEKQVKFRFDEVDWLQFTGLLDKNGREIFEGYVCAVIDDIGAPIESGEKTDNVEVKFTPDCLKFFEEHASTSYVIGNIYENPELLNV